MTSLARFLGFIAVVVVALPPQWCQAIPAAPFACCDGCANELEEDQPSDEPQENICQCGKIAFKQPDPIIFTFEVAAAAEVSLTPTVDQELVDILDLPPRNRQQLYCRWRN